MNRRTEKLIHTAEELQTLMALRHQVFNSIASSLHEGDLEKLEQYCEDADNSGMLQRDVFGLSPMLTGLQTAQIAIEEIGVKRDGVIAIILYKALMAFEGNKTGDNT